MMFWMDSKVFQNNFLTNERDQDILDAQYVLVSTRIKKRKSLENVINGNAMLYPDPEVCTALTDDDYMSRYMMQCSKSKPFIATLIKGSIEEKYNIIFICSKKERKQKYLGYLSNYVFIEFGYPIYEYKLYASGALPLESYNKKKVLKKCNKILNEAKEANYNKEIQSKDGRKRLMKEFKEKKSSELVKYLKKRNLYHDSMSRRDMLDMIETFM